MLAYMGGISPIILILLLEPELDFSVSQMILGGGTWTTKLEFIQRLLLISRKIIFDFDTLVFFVIRFILGI